MPNNLNHNSEVSDKERFELLYARLKGIHDTFIDVVFKATGAFLLVTGWIVTSDTARNYLKSDSISRWLGILGLLVVYAVLYAIAAYRTAQSSQRISKQLDEVAYMPHEYYSDLIVPKALTAAYTVANFAFCIAVAIFMLRITG